MICSEKLTRVLFESFLTRSKQPHRDALIAHMKETHAQSINARARAVCATSADLYTAIEKTLYSRDFDAAREIASGAEVDAFVCRDYLRRAAPAGHPVLPTERNLHDAIVRRDDQTALLLLTQGAPFSQRSLLELLDAHNMSRTACFVLNGGMVDVTLIGYQAWLGCVNSPNVPLAHSIFERSLAIQAAFRAESDQRRQQIGHQFFYWTSRHLAQMALDGQSVQQFKAVFDTSRLAPAELLALVRRCSDLWTELPDSAIVSCWHEPTFASCFLPLTQLVADYNDPKPNFTGFFLEATRKLTREVLSGVNSDAIYAILFLPTVVVPAGDSRCRALAA